MGQEIMQADAEKRKRGRRCREEVEENEIKVENRSEETVYFDLPLGVTHTDHWAPSYHIWKKKEKIAAEGTISADEATT